MTIEQTIEAIVRRVLAERDSQPANDAHVTVAEYARRRSISESTVRQAIRANRLPCLRVGRAVRVPADEEIAPAVRDTTQRARAKLLGR
jgi:excisionase family DNA binding protein